MHSVCRAERLFHGYLLRVLPDLQIHILARQALSVPRKILKKDAGCGMLLIISRNADFGEGDPQLQLMVDRFRAKFPKKTRVINIQEFPFKGGCLGCFHCAVSGKCVYGSL